MIGDLISRSELYGIESLLMTDIVENDPVAKYVLEQVLHDIKAVPAVEAEPVVHAHWFGNDDPQGWFDKIVYCSACKCGDSTVRSPRCRYCGAHMDEEVAE